MKAFRNLFGTGEKLKWTWVEEQFGKSRMVT
jgi:hypothetical protein